MKIKTILSQHRRDFTAKMFCEFCEHEEVLNGGYDDRNYHDNVIPTMKCTSCGETTITGDGRVSHTETKYPEGYQI